jgi:hypothetical protein
VVSGDWMSMTFADVALFRSVAWFRSGLSFK